MSRYVLITGGTGLIGKPLTDALLSQGHQVAHLSRSSGKDPRVRTFLWDVKKGEIDPACINGVDTIVHLAGAGIAEKRWTNKRRKELIDSRTRSIGLLYDLLERTPDHEVKKVVSASGINIYGSHGDEWLTEQHPPEHDFLGDCCVQWEAAVNQGAAMGLSVTKLRTGVVLTTKGGALKPLSLPVKFGFGAPLGNGRQYVPWLHMDDAVDIYLKSIEGSIPEGVYNMLAPDPVTNEQLTKAIARQLKRPLWLPKVPAFMIRLVMGEMSKVVLSSVRASAQKLTDVGYRFKYNVIADALKDIYEQKRSS